MKTKWKRSEDGYCESVDGKWWITPLYCGRVKPQFYDLLYYPDGRGQGAKSQKIMSMASSQRECKEFVDRHKGEP